MALKPDRSILETDISLVCNTVISKGVALVYATGSTAASGAGVYTPGAAEKAAASSGRVPAGISLTSFVDIDQTRFHRNFHKDEQIIGEKVPLLRKGWVITDQLIPSLTILAGETAYVGASGLLTNVASTNPKVGQFAGGKDENGFVKVHINIPAV